MIQIYNEDSINTLSGIPTGFIDLILQDPPYDTTNCEWDCSISLEDFWIEWERVLKPNGAVVIFGQQPFTSKLIMSNLKMFKYCWTWIKERPTNVFQVKRRPGKNTEDIIVFYKKQPTYHPQKTEYVGKPRTNKVKDGKLGNIIDSQGKTVREYKDDGTRYPVSTLYFQRDTLTSNLHPTQKPLALVEYLVRTYTNEGDRVFDGFVGSGTVPLACANLSRNFIGAEKNKEYFEIAKQRVKRYAHAKDK